MRNIWIGNIRRVGSNTPGYLYNESNNTVEFRTLKDKKEIAMLDKKEGILYFNTLYKTDFKKIKQQIIKDYAPKNTSEYFNMF